MAIPGRYLGMGSGFGIGDLFQRSLAFARDARALQAWAPVGRARDARVARGFAPEFRAWLSVHGYGAHAFADVKKPAYGGKPGKGRPVVLIHGNSDSADGWAKVIPELERQGLQVFALSVGDADKKKAAFQHDSPQAVREVKDFLEAVRKYTGQKQVDVVGHSLGNLLAARAMVELAQEGRRPVGTYVSIAGANRGHVGNLGQRLNPWAHLLAPSAPAFDPTRPFFGEIAGGLPVRRSYGVYGTGDVMLGLDARRTGPVPGEERHFELDGLGHSEARDLTPRLLGAILRGRVPDTGWESLVDPR